MTMATWPGAVRSTNWIDRANDRFKAAQEQAGQIVKLNTMIAAELVDVACGLMSAKQLVGLLQTACQESWCER